MYFTFTGKTGVLEAAMSRKCLILLQELCDFIDAYKE
jgi:hypothetical protein